MKRYGLAFVHGSIFALPFIFGPLVSFVLMTFLSEWLAFFVGGFSSILMFHLTAKPRNYIEKLYKPPTTLGTSVIGMIGVLTTSMSTYFIGNLIAPHLNLQKINSSNVAISTFAIGVVSCLLWSKVFRIVYPTKTAR